jgi:hypothetical protein
VFWLCQLCSLLNSHRVLHGRHVAVVAAAAAAAAAAVCARHMLDPNWSSLSTVGVFSAHRYKTCWAVCSMQQCTEAARALLVRSCCQARLVGHTAASAPPGHSCTDTGLGCQMLQPLTGHITSQLWHVEAARPGAVGEQLYASLSSTGCFSEAC